MIVFKMAVFYALAHTFVKKVDKEDIFKIEKNR